MKLAPAIAILMACSLGCGKKPDSGAPPADDKKPAAGSGSAAADSAATAGSAAATGSAAPTAGSAAPATGSATPPAAGSAAPPAAADTDPRTSELCSEVLVKILDCHKDKAFLAALDEGVDAKRKTANKKHLVQIVKWKYNDCGALPTAIEDGGFLDNWATVSGTPGVLDSCGKLGAALRQAGGLFGGDIAN